MMKTVSIKHKPMLRIMALPVLVSFCLLFSCQEEENSLAKTGITYEELAAEVENLSAAMKGITDNYPDYRIDMQQIFKMPEKEVTTRSFEEVISGINNVSDKQKVSAMHYQMHTLRQQMFGLPDASGTYTAVDEQPTPENGLQEFYAYIQKNLEYPAQARRMGIEGRVFVEFVVDANGAITEVKALKGIGAGCDAEAVRVLKNAAAWNPGRHQGKPVKVRMVLPVTYKL